MKHFNIHPILFSIRPLFILLLAIPVFFSCCSGNKSSKPNQSRTTLKSAKKQFSLNVPTNFNTITHGNEIEFNFRSEVNTPIDSITVRYKSQQIQTIISDGNPYKLLVEPGTVGKTTYKLTIHYTDSLKENHQLKTFVLSEIVPGNLSYRVLKKIDHDPQAYTQGLMYHNGFLYESTGRKNRSSIRKINPDNGEILNKKAIDPELFGEGITLVGDEIFMITYTSQVGFVFDAENFDLLRKFNLQTREGWGLTTYNSELILSDGSATLYFYDPIYFSLTKQMEVCDNQRIMGNLNELEYTPYGLFANVYGEDYILLIDPERGTVLGKLDLSELFPAGVPKNYEHVLNGIAYNKESDTFYVTGKQWPVMYEIRILFD